MPELPEVETMCRGIAGLQGGLVRAVEFPAGRRLRPLACRPSRRAIARGIVGSRLVSVGRRGKRAVLEFAAGSPRASHEGNRSRFLVVEPRMTGLLLVAPPPTDEHVRLVVRFDRPRAATLAFWDRRGLGTLSLVDACGLEAVCGRERLGPDALGITASLLEERLGESRRAVKVALLDQRAVAGIGNLYASEILFHAGIDPRARCRRLGAGQWERLAAAAREVLRTAVEMEGSTLGDATYRTAENREGRFQSRHRVYAREGRACGRCRSAVRRIVQAQRSTFFCPGCQVAAKGRRG